MIRKFILPYRLHFLLFAVVAFLAAGGAFQWANKSKVISKQAHQLESHLQAQFRTARSNIQDASLVEKMARQQLSRHELEKLNRDQYLYALYDQDSLQWWSDYQVDIPPLARFVKPGEPLMRLENGFYKIFSEQYKVDNKSYYAVVLIPVKYQYDIENQYLQSQLACFDLPPAFSFSVTPPDDDLEYAAVNGISGEELFYIYQIDDASTQVYPPVSLWAFIVGMLFVLLFINALAKRIGQRYGNGWGWLFFALVIFLLRYATLFWFYPAVLLGYEVFSPQYYASSDWAPSLGDLFINVVLIAWIAWFFYKYVRLQSISSKALQYLVGTLGIALLFSFSYYILEVTETLVIDSNLSFDINNFLSIQIYSWLGVVLISLLFGSFFVTGYRLLTPLFHWFHHWMPRLGILAAGLVIWLLLFLNAALPIDLLISGVVGLIFMILAMLQTGRYWQLSRLQTLTLWLIFAALISGMYLNRFNGIKERENEILYADLLLQKDYLTEFLFSQIKEEIVTDPFIKNYFKEDYITKKQLEDQINFVYLKGHLSKYDIQIKTFEQANDKGLPSKLKRYYALIDSSGQPTEVEDLYFFSQSPDKLEYLAVIRVYEDPDKPRREELLGRLVIALQTKSIGYSTIYPELLLKDNATPPELYNKYDYAIYVNKRLVKRSGNFAYPVTVADTMKKGVKSLKMDGYKHVIYQEQPGKMVWVSQPVDGVLERFSLFSIILLINIIILLVILGGTALIRHPLGALDRLKMKNVAFSTRIQTIVIGIIIISFLIIGAVVISNIINEYDRYHRDRLIRKSKQILSNLEYLKNESADTTSTWQELLSSSQLKADLSNLSEVHTMDFNIYNNKGFLIESSQPGVFERGLIAHNMHPLARYALLEKNKSQYIQQEHIGSLNFLASYIPIMDQDNKLQAILNLPYYAKEKNLKTEISNFLVYFINIYVILLAIAAGLGLVISNSLTRPISQLGERMRKVQLGARNTPIQWKNKDEIGRLIDEYNSMLEQLEESARLLAQTERESAWREMARQVAHEIKNPLTPMRLSIQHLQRTAMQADSNEGDRIKNVCNTLLAQIDQLSHIASEFSNFAKMPRAENEALELAGIVESVVHLYDNESVQITFSKAQEKYPVFADSNQLSRVFQNLVKNAVEAIPVDTHGKVAIAMQTYTTERKPYVQVTIKDNGVGMDEDQQARIFEPNFTTKTTGTGLGLPISRKIIELAGGSINVESVPGEGATFTVSLPLYMK